MKRAHLIITCALLAVSCLAGGMIVYAGAYSIDWHTIDGGGGTSTGGVYRVSGTIGQPDARTGAMVGGSYALRGGFWAAVAVQVPGAPHLHIEATGPSEITISWEPDAPGWTLQKSLSLSPTNWVGSASGSANPTTVPISTPKTFYRLFKP